LTVVNFKQLIEHYGHDVNLTFFGLHGKIENAVNVAIVCDTCCIILFDFDNEENIKVND